MGAIYVECSSKETEGVDEVFELAVNTAVGQEIQRKERESHQRMATATTMGLGFGSKAKKSKKKDCVIL